jgi:epidermal growth factor receptor substrate 15
MTIIQSVFMLSIYILNYICCSACIYPGFSIIKELTVEVEPPAVAKSQPTEDVKASSNGASTEKEDNKGDKSAAAVEQVVKPETAPSNIKPESAKSPPVSPVKNKEDGPDEHDKKQSGTNDVSPRESIRYRLYFSFFI